MSSNTHVPDKLHGYTLQVRHMMYELISHNLEQVVSVEALEDVAIESENKVVVEQIKSVQSSNNPIADRSLVFWKSLYNWVNYVNMGSLSLDKTIFRFVVISDRNVVEGEIVESFHKANSVEEARIALKAAQDSLWGAGNELKTQIPSGYGSYLETVFDSDNTNTIEQIVKAMEIEIHSAQYDEVFYNKFCSQPIPLEYAEELFTYMLGWVFERVNAQTKYGLAAYIKCKDFRDALQSQMRRYNQNGILASVATRPSDSETQIEIDRQDLYIKQLGLIDVDVSERFKAANDFLRTSAEKTAWAERGIVTPQSFEDYYDSLVRLWGIQSKVISLTPTSSNTISGQRLYWFCQDKVRSSKVQGNDTPEFFGAGSLHTLANEPPQEPLIGWHPNYKDMLKENDETKE